MSNPTAARPVARTARPAQTQVARPVTRPAVARPAGAVRPAARPALTNTASAQPAASGWLKRGAAIGQGYEEEHARQEAAAAKRASGADFAWRFRLNAGESGEIVILDNSLEECVAFHEHNLKGRDGKYGNFEGCPKEFEICPLCEAYGESYYVMMLSCLDLRGYDRKDEKGTVIEHVEAVRRLLPIKTTSMPRFRELAEVAMQQHGTLRGMYLNMARSSDGQSANIGEPSLLSNGSIFAMYSEDDVLANFGHEAVMSRDGKSVLKEANADCYPFEYEVLFPKPEAADIAKRYRLTAAPGGKGTARAQWDNGTSPDDDQIPMGNEPPAGGTRTRPGAVKPAAGTARPVARPAAASPPQTAKPVAARPAPARPAAAQPEPEAEPNYWLDQDGAEPTLVPMSEVQTLVDAGGDPLVMPEDQSNDWIAASGMGFVAVEPPPARPQPARPQSARPAARPANTVQPRTARPVARPAAVDPASDEFAGQAD